METLFTGWAIPPGNCFTSLQMRKRMNTTGFFKEIPLEKELAKRNPELEIGASLKGNKPLSKNQKNEIKMPFSK